MTKTTSKGPHSKAGKQKRHSKIAQSLPKILPDQLSKIIRKKWERAQKKGGAKMTQRAESQQETLTFQRMFGQLKEESLNCPICLDYCIEPVLTQCGHYFCMVCFEQAHRTTSTCSVCRAQIDTVNYEGSRFLKMFFKEYIQNKIDWAEAEIYWNRERQYLKRDAKRNPSQNLRVGEKVDLRLQKLNKMWVEGRITKAEERSVEVEYLDLETDKIQTITVSKKSRALARHRFFTYDPKAAPQKKPFPPISIIYRTYRRRRVVPTEQEPVEPTLTESQIENMINERMRRNNWEQDLVQQEEDQNENAWLIDESSPVFQNAGSNLWQIDLTDQNQQNVLFQLVR